MACGIDDIALCALFDEELPSDEQSSGEDERDHRGRELTGIVHRENFHLFGPQENASRSPQFLFISKKLPLLPDARPARAYTNRLNS